MFERIEIFEGSTGLLNQVAALVIEGYHLETERKLEEPTATFKQVPLSDAKLAEYAGSYYCRALHTGFSINVEGGELALRNCNRYNTGADLNYCCVAPDPIYEQAGSSPAISPNYIPKR